MLIIKKEERIMNSTINGLIYEQTIIIMSFEL